MFDGFFFLSALDLHCGGRRFGAVSQLGCSVACGILLLQTRMEPTSPTLEGRFLTTGPPGESLFNDV